MEKTVHENQNKFSILNSALWTDSLFIYLPENVSADLPISLLWMAYLMLRIKINNFLFRSFGYFRQKQFPLIFGLIIATCRCYL